MSDKNDRVVCKTGLKVELRPFDMENDLPIVYKHINREEVNRFLKVHGPLTLAQERKHFENVENNRNNIIFSIVDKATGQFIGIIGLHEIDYATRMATTGMVIILEEFWNKGYGTDGNKGYGTDAKMLLMDYAFNRLNFHRLNSSVIAFNDRSAGCLIRCGYVQEGIRRKYHYREGQYYDQILFGVLQEEFQEIWPAYAERIKAEA